MSHEKCQTTGGQGFTLQAAITKAGRLAGKFAFTIRKMQVGTAEVRRKLVDLAVLAPLSFVNSKQIVPLYRIKLL